jgi:MoxR-like ATPases
MNTITRAAEILERLRDTIGQAMVGQTEVVDQVIVTIVAAGHALIEGVPGLGKTLLVRALSRAMSLNYGRVQFTPDMMPSDITGHAVLDSNTRELRVVRGPVFTQVLLADEINRAPAKTQSALLEVMQEYQVTLEGQTLPLPQPFFVLATQNPVETEGTYPLPEAQLDRFLLKIEIAYPSVKEEVDIVLRTTINQTGQQLPLEKVQPVLSERSVLSLQQIAARQRVDESVVDYAVRIVRATREWPGIAIGAGSRGAISLVRAARVVALMAGRDFVTPDDIKRIAFPALSHRIALAPDALLEGRNARDLLTAVVDERPGTAYLSRYARSLHPGNEAALGRGRRLCARGHRARLWILGRGRVSIGDCVVVAASRCGVDRSPHHAASVA